MLKRSIAALPLLLVVATASAQTAGINSALSFGSCTLNCAQNVDDAFFNTTTTPVSLQQFDVE